MEIVELKERDTLSVRYRTSMEQLSTGMGQVYGEISGHMAKKGIPFAGPPFAVYYNMDMNDLDVEIGFPVASQGAGTPDADASAASGDRVRPGKLPGGKHAVAAHLGPYDTIGQTYEKLAAFVKERGFEPEAFMYEEYLNSPVDTPPEKLETNIYFPLKG